METRAVVKSGNTSFTVALPIDWVRRNRLDKGSQVTVTESPAGELLIAAQRTPTVLQETITIKVDGKKDEAINLELLQAYIRDYGTIVIEGKELRAKSRALLALIKNYIGVDVIEHGVDTIVVKNFFSISKETAPHTIARKIGAVSRSIFEVLDALYTKGFTKDDVAEIQRLHEQSERLFNLVRKTTLKLIEHPSLMSQAQTDSVQLFKDKLVAMNFRNIAGSLHAVGRTFLLLEHRKKEIALLQEVMTATRKNLELALSVYTRKDYDTLGPMLASITMENERWEQLAREVDNALVVDCIREAIDCNLFLRDIAHQLLE